MGRTLIGVIGIALLAVIAHQALRTYTKWHGFAHYYPHQPGPCKKVDGVQPGSEDFHTLSNGLTFITSGLRYAPMSSKCKDYWRRHNVKGRIYLMDLGNVKAGVKDLKISSTPQFDADTFVPHGISVWEDKKAGRHVVFVVNHPYGGAEDRVEKFVYNPEKQELVHEKFFSDPAMLLVNDVVATGENSFYFTNSNYFRTHAGLLVELLLELPLLNVVYYDGESYSVVESGLSGPNGIAMSLDSQYVYVAHMLAQEILVFKRHQNNSLTLMQKYPLYTFLDNIQVDKKTGHLYVGAHPIGYKLLEHLNDITLQSPSQVIHLAVEDGVIKSSQELFYNHGDIISASSSAIVFDGTLLVGSVYDSLITCQVNVPLL